jgi:hypothetical protein
VYVEGFYFLVNKWIRLFKIILYPLLTQQICPQGKSDGPELFGSSVIDFLECLLDCKKDITVNIDSKGWCYIKGQYKLNGTSAYTDVLPCYPLRLKPLTVCKQKEVYDWWYSLARSNNNYYLWSLRHCEELDIDFNDVLSELDHALCDNEWYYRTLYDQKYGKVNRIFEVDLKCRKNWLL